MGCCLFRHEALLSARVCPLDPSSFCPLPGGLLPEQRALPRHVMRCHDPHAQGVCAAVSSGIGRPSPRSTPRPREVCVCLRPAIVPSSRFVPFRSGLPSASPAAAEPFFREQSRAGASGRARFAAARFARLIAPARAKQMQGARLPWVPVGFSCAGAGAEGGAASGSRLLLHHSNTEISGSSPLSDFFLK